jgi:hypothetical protein
MIIPDVWNVIVHYCDIVTFDKLKDYLKLYDKIRGNMTNQRSFKFLQHLKYNKLMLYVYIEKWNYYPKMYRLAVNSNKCALLIARKDKDIELAHTYKFTFRCCNERYLVDFIHNNADMELYYYDNKYLCYLGGNIEQDICDNYLLVPYYQNIFYHYLKLNKRFYPLDDVVDYFYELIRDQIPLDEVVEEYVDSDCSNTHNVIFGDASRDEIKILVAKYLTRGLYDEYICELGHLFGDIFSALVEKKIINFTDYIDGDKLDNPS